MAQADSKPSKKVVLLDNSSSSDNIILTGAEIDDLLPSIIKTANNKYNSNNSTSKVYRPKTFWNSYNQPTANVYPVNLDSEYSCPLFENKTYSDLIAAIDSLNTEMSADKDCSKESTIATVVENNKKLKGSLSTLYTFLKRPAGSPAVTEDDLVSIDNETRTAVAAAESIANVIGNSGFVNSDCGKKSLSTGQALLTVNNVLNGLSPFLLKLITLNPSLSAGIPYVIGGVALTSGISALSEMISAKTLDMENPIHRQAVLQNTCQYIKVSQKVRYLELLQYGKVDEITKNLDKNIQLYQSQFAESTANTKQMLTYKSTIEADLDKSNQALIGINSQLQKIKNLVDGKNTDQLTCNLGTEMANNYENNFVTDLIQQVNHLGKLVKLNPADIEWTALQKSNLDSIEKLHKANENSLAQGNSIEACKDQTLIWIDTLTKIHGFAQTLSKNIKLNMDKTLSQNPDYYKWYKQNAQIIEEQENLKRFKNLMQTLAEPNSVIEKSELAERIKILHQNIFKGRRSYLVIQSGSPVQSWLEHKLQEHLASMKEFKDQFALLMNKGWQSSSYMEYMQQRSKSSVVVTKAISDNYYKSLQQSRNLTAFDLPKFPLGTDNHRIACQQLESAWISYTRAISHLGASQLFCQLIDSQLDTGGTQKKTLRFCRGKETYSKKTVTKNDLSVIDSAKYDIINGDLKTSAQHVIEAMNRLACPGLSAQ